jgi:hypothetical protein
MHGLAAAQIETGMMPGAANGIAHHKALGERPLIMRAMRVHGEDFRAGFDEQDILIADATEQLAACEVRDRDARSQIGSTRF